MEVDSAAEDPTAALPRAVLTLAVLMPVVIAPADLMRGGYRGGGFDAGGVHAGGYDAPGVHANPYAGHGTGHVGLPTDGAFDRSWAARQAIPGSHMARRRGQAVSRPARGCHSELLQPLHAHLAPAGIMAILALGSRQAGPPMQLGIGPPGRQSTPGAAGARGRRSSTNTATTSPTRAMKSTMAISRSPRPTSTTSRPRP